MNERMENFVVIVPTIDINPLTENEFVAYLHLPV